MSGLGTNGLRCNKVTLEVQKLGKMRLYMTNKFLQKLRKISVFSEIHSQNPSIKS